MTDSQKRLDRNLRNILGENSHLVKTYKHEEVMDLLLAARSKGDKTSIEFNGGIEHLCESRLKTAGFRSETFTNPQNVIVTVISW